MTDYSAYQVPVGLHKRQKVICLLSVQAMEVPNVHNFRYPESFPQKLLSPEQPTIVVAVDPEHLGLFDEERGRIFI